jgi:sugar lactone lactonase YvrE
VARASDGLETDDHGRLHLTSGEHNAILRRQPDGTFDTLVHDSRLLWPDTMSVAGGYLYVTANQLYRQDKYQLAPSTRAGPAAALTVTRGCSGA